jgi:hypothetical protein
MFPTLCRDAEISGHPLKPEALVSGGDLEPKRQLAVCLQVVAGPATTEIERLGQLQAFERFSQLRLA